VARPRADGVYWSVVTSSDRRIGPRPNLSDRLRYVRDALGATLRGEPPIPNPRLRLPAGRADFTVVGRQLLQILIDIGGLRPEERVLDVGCGPGRVARGLVGYLSPAGSYEGFDVVPQAIAWCRQKIAPRHPNFRFTHVDIRNDMYNPKGSIEPSTFAFPYSSDEFDLVFLFSVFTHMLPVDVDRYLGEIRRVLRPGGRCLMTFFLLTEASEEAMREGRATRTFPHQAVGYRSGSIKVHERAVAYGEEVVRRAIDRVGLRVREPILHGSWAGGRAPLGQDIVVVLKPDRPGLR
jgi:SAM-dependent methyltransferase